MKGKLLPMFFGSSVNRKELMSNIWSWLFSNPVYGIVALGALYRKWKIYSNECAIYLVSIGSLLLHI